MTENIIFYLVHPKYDISIMRVYTSCYRRLYFVRTQEYLEKRVIFTQCFENLTKIYSVYKINAERQRRQNIRKLMKRKGRFFGEFFFSRLVCLYTHVHLLLGLTSTGWLFCAVNRSSRIESTFYSDRSEDLL